MTDPDELVAWLCDLEREHGLLELRLDGVAFWHLVRMPVYCRLAIAAGLMKPNRFSSFKTVPGQMRQAVGPGTLGLTRGAVANLVVPAQTRFLGPHGRIEPLTARVLHELPPGQARVLEMVPVEPRDCDYLGHRDVVRAQPLFRLSGWLASMRARWWRRSGAASRDAATLSILEGPVRDAFCRRGYDAGDLRGLALSAAFSYRCARVLYALLLRRWRPRRVYLTVSYGKEALIDAARAAGARVIEFQHGLVRRHHVGYHFPFGMHDSGRPDLLAAFGEYWCADARLAPCTRTVVVGSTRIEPDPALAVRDQILVLSGQPFEGDDVVDYARALALAYPARTVTVRTHPNQRTGYEKALAGSSNVSFDPGDRPVEQALRCASHVVSGCSTALFEALALGCRVLLVDSGHTGWINAALGADACAVVGSPDEAVRMLERARPAHDMARFMASPTPSVLAPIDAALAT